MVLFYYNYTVFRQLFKLKIRKKNIHICSLSACTYLFFDILLLVLQICNLGSLHYGYTYLINFISKESKTRIIIFTPKINYCLVHVVYLLQKNVKRSIKRNFDQNCQIFYVNSLNQIWNSCFKDLNI